MRALVQAEWIKFRSLRSGPLLLLGAAVVGTALSRLGALQAGTDPARAGGPDGPPDPVADCLAGLPLAQLLLAVLGVLVIGSEYGSGMITTTLVAMPRRGRALAAKLLVVGGATAVVGQAVCWAAFLANRSLLARDGVPAASLGDPAVLRAVTAAGLYLCAVALIGAGLAAALRNTAAGLAAWFVVVFLLPALTGAVERWSPWPSRLALANAGDVLVRVVPTSEPRLPSVAVACAVLAAYPVLALGLGRWRARRDV